MAPSLAPTPQVLVGERSRQAVARVDSPLPIDAVHQNRVRTGDRLSTSDHPTRSERRREKTQCIASHGRARIRLAGVKEGAPTCRNPTPDSCNLAPDIRAEVGGQIRCRPSVVIRCGLGNAARMSLVDDVEAADSCSRREILRLPVELAGQIRRDDEIEHLQVSDIESTTKDRRHLEAQDAIVVDRKSCLASGHGQASEEVLILAIRCRKARA